MRGRSIRLSILIVLLLAISIATLAFREINIDIPGLELSRNGAGPLGLKLGLDLQGGADLRYEADTGTRINVTFSQPTDAGKVEKALVDLGISGFEVAPQDATSVRIASPLLDSRTRQDLRKALSSGSTVEVAFTDEVSATPDDIGQTLGSLGFTDYDVQAPGQGVASVQLPSSGSEGEPAQQEVQAIVQGTFRIEMPTLEEAQRQEIREALEKDIGAIASFEVTNLALVDWQVSEVTQPTPDQMDGVVDTINRRVNLFGTEEPIVQLFGENRVKVQLPGASGSITDVQFSQEVSAGELESLLSEQGFRDFTVTGRGERSFRIATDSLNLTRRQELQTALSNRFGIITSFVVTGGIEQAKDLIGSTARLEFKERTCTDAPCLTFTDADIGLTGDDLSDAFFNQSPQTAEWAVNIQFNNRGAEIFSQLTERIVGQTSKRIAVILDDEEIIAPVARAWIRDGRSQITGNFTREEARLLSVQLKSGSLPVPLKLIQQREVDAFLGSEDLAKSLIAGLVGLGLVMVFMVAYYRMAGVVAACALVFYSIIVLALFKLIPVTLTLPHIGGFILSIGFAVDANILIFERMKEEIRIGRTLASSMEVGFSRAWPAIRDSNISTMITCLVLLWFGNRLGGGLVFGFAVSLLIGVAVSMFTAVVVSRNLLQLTAWIGLGHRINLFSPEGAGRPAHTFGDAQTAGRGR